MRHDPFNRREPAERCHVCGLLPPAGTRWCVSDTCEACRYREACRRDGASLLPLPGDGPLTQLETVALYGDPTHDVAEVRVAGRRIGTLSSTHTPGDASFYRARIDGMARCAGSGSDRAEVLALMRCRWFGSM